MKNLSPILTLLMVGTLSAILWRVEVEYHGWEGLIWVSYFHWAIPCGVLLFATWLCFFCGVKPFKKRVLFVSIFILFSAVSYVLTYDSVTVYYSGWIGLIELPWWYWIRLYLIYLIVPSVSILFLVISRLFSDSVTLRRSVLSLSVYALAFPVAILLLEITQHRGRPDVLHAIKSGFVIPFLILSLGIPFVFKSDNSCGESEN